MFKPRMMITLLTAALALLMILPGCGEPRSPGDVVRSVFDAYNARDFDKAYDLSSTALQDQSGSRDDALKRMAASWPEGTEIVDFEITGEQIDGDQATVTWSGTIKTPGVPDEPGSASIALVKEDGEWRISP